MGIPYVSCPKCGHFPLPKEQAFPCECPACGLILAKYRPAPPSRSRLARQTDATGDGLGRRLLAALLWVPETVNPVVFWGRCACYLALSLWGWHLASLDVATGELGASFVHNILLPFHEAGHVIFRPFGEFITYLGGTLGQLLMPLALGVALLKQNGDSFGASLGLWLFAVSLMDVTPYMYDALHPQLMLLSGTTGAEGGDHDWIYLFGRLGQINNAQSIGMATRHLAVAVMLLSNAWGAYLLLLQYRRVDGTAS